MSGTLKVTAELDVSGPLSDGTADRVLKEWVRNTAQALADQGVDRLRAWPMDKTGRARGGFQENLKTRERGPGIVEIPGPQITGVTWAPWLEGTSKRNQSTHFKGYKLFRKTRLELQRKAVQVGEDELEKLMPELGGE